MVTFHKFPDFGIGGVLPRQSVLSNLLLLISIITVFPTVLVCSSLNKNATHFQVRSCMQICIEAQEVAFRPHKCFQVLAIEQVYCSLSRQHIIIIYGAQNMLQSSRLCPGYSHLVVLRREPSFYTLKKYHRWFCCAMIMRSQVQ